MNATEKSKEEEEQEKQRSLRRVVLQSLGAQWTYGIHGTGIRAFHGFHDFFSFSPVHVITKKYSTSPRHVPQWCLPLPAIQLSSLSLSQSDCCMRSVARLCAFCLNVSFIHVIHWSNTASTQVTWSESESVRWVSEVGKWSLRSEATSPCCNAETWFWQQGLSRLCWNICQSHVQSPTRLVQKEQTWGEHKESVVLGELDEESHSPTRATALLVEKRHLTTA